MRDVFLLANLSFPPQVKLDANSFYLGWILFGAMVAAVIAILIWSRNRPVVCVITLFVCAFAVVGLLYGHFYVRHARYVPLDHYLLLGYHGFFSCLVICVVRFATREASILMLCLSGVADSFLNSSTSVAKRRWKLMEEKRMA